MVKTAGQLGNVLAGNKAQVQAAAAAAGEDTQEEGKLSEDAKEAMKIKELAKIRRNELELAQLNKAHRKIKLQ